MRKPTNRLSLAETMSVIKWCQDNADRVRTWTKTDAAKFITAHAGLGFEVTERNLDYIENETAGMGARAVKFGNKVKKEAVAVAGANPERAQLETLRIVAELRDDIRALRSELAESLFLRAK